jgi:hypothetical protein
MNLKKPRTCRGCRWYTTYSGTRGYCLYHFSTEKVEPILWRNYTAFEDIYVDIRPVGECPKPLTIAEAVYWVEFAENKMKTALSPIKEKL